MASARIQHQRASVRHFNSPASDLDASSMTLLETGDPEHCVALTHNPSLHVYNALKSRIESSSPSWLQQFLELDGLGSLISTLEQLSRNTCGSDGSFSGAILQLDCLSCVKAILNTNIGMTYFLQHQNYTRKLVMALECPNTLAKKHMFEVLTAVCVYSHLGHYRVLDALENFKKMTHQSSKLSIVMTELKLADTVNFKASLMALINAIINCTQDLLHRNRIRHEFVGLQLLDVIAYMKREEKDADLSIQFEVFSVEKHRDETELIDKHGAIDFNSHQDVFYSLYSKVLGTPECISFLEILQDLYLMDATNCESSHFWRIAAQAVHCVSSLQNKTEAESLIEKLSETSTPGDSSRLSKGSSTRSKYSGSSQLERQTVKRSSNRRKKTPGSEEDGAANLFKDIIVAGAPDMKSMDRKDSGISCMSSSPGNMTPYDNIPTNDNFVRQGSGRCSKSAPGIHLTPVVEGESTTNSNPGSRTSQLTRSSGVMRSRSPQVIPRRKTKWVKWIKVSPSLAKESLSIWNTVDESKIGINYKTLEEEFADSGCVVDDEIELLTAEQSLALNLFLSRCEMNYDELVDCIEDADETKIGLSAIRHLQNILPSHQEIEQLRRYDGSRAELGQPEQFLLLLSDLKDYRTLISALAFKSEFRSKYEKLRSAFEAMTKACKNVLHHPGLRDFLALVLKAGNFLNNNSPFGEAYGISTSSLARLSSVFGSKPERHLLGFLVRVVEAQNDETLLFLHDMCHLYKASSHNLDDLKQEVSQLNSQLRKLLLQLASAEPELREAFEYFVEDVKKDLEQLGSSILTLKGYSHQMALYFCEEETTFDLKSCFTHLHEFCDAIKKCRRDGWMNKQHSTIAKYRQQHLQKQSTDKQTTTNFGNRAAACSSFVHPNLAEGLVDGLLAEIQAGRVEAGMGDMILGPPEDEGEENQLAISRIPHMSSHTNLTLDSMVGSEFRITDIPAFGRPCLASRMECAVIPKHYWRDKQSLSSSFLDPENQTKRRVGGGSVHLESPAVISTRKYAKASEIKLGHRRINSDLDRTLKSEEKWKKYEVQQAVQMGILSSTAEKPESRCPIASLSLETFGKTLSTDDIEVLRHEVLDDNKSKKKRSAFGFFRRMGRTVLKTRNTEYNIEPDANLRGSKKYKKQVEQDSQGEFKSNSLRRSKKFKRGNEDGTRSSKRFGLRDSKRFNIVPSVLRSSKGKGSKSLKKKANDSSDGDKENVPVTTLGVRVTELTNKHQALNPSMGVNCQFMPPVATAHPIRDKKNVAVKVYSKYP